MDPADAVRASSAERVGLRTLRERRRRVLRGLLMVGLATLVILVLSILNRDEAAINTCRNHMELARTTLQDQHDRGRPTPARLPLPDPDAADHESVERLERLRQHTYYNALFALQPGRRGEEVGVCCCRWPHSRLVGKAGRHILVFKPQEQRFEMRWLPESEFKRQADELGLRVPAVGSLP